MAPRTQDIDERLVIMPSGCWEWPLDEPYVRRGGRKLSVKRIKFFERWPTSSRRALFCSCFNRRCCNPDHHCLRPNNGKRIRE